MSPALFLRSSIGSPPFIPRTFPRFRSIPASLRLALALLCVRSVSSRGGSCSVPSSRSAISEQPQRRSGFFHGRFGYEHFAFSRAWVRASFAESAFDGDRRGQATGTSRSHTIFVLTGWFRARLSRSGQRSASRAPAQRPSTRQHRRRAGVGRRTGGRSSRSSTELCFCCSEKIQQRLSSRGDTCVST